MTSSKVHASLFTFILVTVTLISVSMFTTPIDGDGEKAVDDCEVDVGELTRSTNGDYVKGSMLYEGFRHDGRYGTYFRVEAPSSGPLLIEAANDFSHEVGERDVAEVWIYYDTVGSNNGKAFIQVRSGATYDPAHEIESWGTFADDGSWGGVSHSTGGMVNMKREWQFISRSHGVNTYFTVGVVPFPGQSNTRHPQRNGVE